MARKPLLSYLRDVLGMRGTKDGCSEGQCGACMVAISAGAQVGYCAANACTRLLGALHGYSVLTIEGLSEGSSAHTCRELHAVQQAMVDAGASQCGFCTPGIVMSLFCLTTSNQNLDRDDLHYALAGNLCRCTGYRPILEAAQSLKNSARRSETHVAPRLEAFSAPLTARGFFSPRSPEELDDCMRAEPKARLIAGGTDLVVDAWKNRRALPSLIYIGRIKELQRIHDDEDHIEIGAAVAMIRAADALVAQYPSLSEFFRRFASAPIANVATLGGNIAGGSPVADTIPLLIALNATVNLCQGSRRRAMSVEDFLTGYRTNSLRAGEYIASIRVPKPSPGQRVRAYKVAKRFEQDTATVVGAFNLSFNSELITEIRISYGAISDAPGRATHLESALLNRTFDQDVLEAGYEALDRDHQPISDFRASAGYRRQVARNMLVKLRADLSGNEPVSLWANDL